MDIKKNLPEKNPYFITQKIQKSKGNGNSYK